MENPETVEDAVLFYPEDFGAVGNSAIPSTEKEKCRQPERESRSHTDGT
jgi:hypothetical protein